MGIIKPKYYSLKNILAKNAQYNVIYGERSNGKTYAVLELGLRNYWNNGKQFAYVRRWQDDFKGKRAVQLFSGHAQNGFITKLTDGTWTDVFYQSGRWFLCKYDEDNKRVVDNNPCGFAFALSSMEHDKSTSYPNVTTICFDEFLTRGMYLPDEFVTFCNVISTIVRYRDDVTVFMLGNTVNKYSPYFKEMGLTNVANQKIGTIDVYKYGDSVLTVAVEYADSPNKSKPSDVYFAFDNPKLSMITGGVWEIELYPHCPVKYVPKDVLFKYFIIFGNDILQCEIIQHNDLLFTFIHRKTTELKDTDNDLIYSSEYNPRTNWRRRLTSPTLPIEKKILSFYLSDNVYFQDNEVGEIVRNYLLWCKASK